MDKYMSVITNFGCHYSCPYCIVKNNNLQIPKSTIDGLNSLEEEIKKNQCNWVSISGGGDPLWNLENNVEWYRKFFDITLHKVQIELHTSMPNVKDAPYAYFDRVVYHLHDFEQLKSIKRLRNEIVRVVFVVTEKFTENLINRIAVYCHNSDIIDELSFRQMVAVMVLQRLVFQVVVAHKDIQEMFYSSSGTLRKVAYISVKSLSKRVSI